MSAQKTKSRSPTSEARHMKACDICRRTSDDVYPLDGHVVCEACLMQGRLDEMPDFAVIERHELDLVGAGAIISSWWNRETPRRHVP
jgi:hypothetical protein